MTLATFLTLAWISGALLLALAVAVVILTIVIKKSSTTATPVATKEDGDNTPDDPADDKEPENGTESETENQAPATAVAAPTQCECTEKETVKAAMEKAEAADKTATQTAEKLDMLIEALSNTLSAEKKSSTIKLMAAKVRENELKYGKASEELEASRAALAGELEGTSPEEYLDERNDLTRTGNDTAASAYGKTYKEVTPEILFGDEETVQKAGTTLKAAHDAVIEGNIPYQEVLLAQDTAKTAEAELAGKKEAHRIALNTASEKAEGFNEPIAKAEEETAAANKHTAIFEKL